MSGNKYRSQRFVFTLTEDPASISSLYVAWEGYSESADSILYIWNDVAGGWEEIGRHSSVAIDGIVSATFTSGITDYIGANGELHLVATGSKAKDMVLYTDYVELVVRASCSAPVPMPTPTATLPPCYYTYDFISGSGADKVAYESGNAGGQPPLPGNVTGVQHESEFTSYAGIESSDDVRYTTTTRGKKHRSHRFAFTINEDPLEATELYVEWEGYTEEADAVLYMWNYTSVGWEEVGRHSTIDDDDAGISGLYTSVIVNYINEDGALHVVVVGPKALWRGLHTDYVKVIVTAPCQ